MNALVSAAHWLPLSTPCRYIVRCVLTSDRPFVLSRFRGRTLGIEEAYGDRKNSSRINKQKVFYVEDVASTRD